MEKIRVLLAEDDVFVSMSLRMRLEQLGFFVVCEASNGVEAIIAADQYKPDIILMDIRMPQMDGLEAAQAILEKHSIPIIFLTAYDEIELIEKAGSLGALGYLVKPVSDRNLSSSLLMARYRMNFNIEFNNDMETKSDLNKFNEGVTKNGVYIKTFGYFEIYQNGTSLKHSLFGNNKSGARKTKALLAYLIFKKNVNKEDLVELFWPLSDWDSAFKSLNRTMHSIKRALQQGLDKGESSAYIIYEDGNYKLNLEHIQVDADLFEAHIKKGFDLVKNNDIIGAEQKFTLAAKLYTGDWMKGVKNAEDWCLSERQRLKNLYTQTKFHLAERSKEKGKIEEALVHYQDIVTHDPYDERANLKLVEAYIQFGKHDLAIKQKEIYNKKIKSLGVF